MSNAVDSPSARVEQKAKALVRLLRRPEPRELPHRPQAPAVHRRVHAAREGNWPGYPRSRSWSRSRSAGFDSGSTSRPEIVENSCGSRCGVRAYRSRQTSRPLPCSVCAIGPIVARNRGSSTADGPEPRPPCCVSVPPLRGLRARRVVAGARRAACSGRPLGHTVCPVGVTAILRSRGHPTAVPPSREQAPRHDVRCAHG